MTERVGEAVQRPVGDDRDTKRLNWIEAQWRDGIHVEVCGKGDGSYWFAVAPAASVFVGPTTHEGATLREAIDSAIAASGNAE